MITHLTNYANSVMDVTQYDNNGEYVEHKELVPVKLKHGDKCKDK